MAVAPVTKPVSKTALRRVDLGLLLEVIQGAGYELIGPTEEEGVVAYRPIQGVDDLPRGWIDRQDGGTYRLDHHPDDPRFFAHVVPQDTWKRWLHPPRQRLLKAKRAGKGFQFESEPRDVAKRALIGVRPCELAAIQILDRVLVQSAYKDSYYASRRENTLIVVANCCRAGGTCFCASMGTGPKAASGFDLALTEIVDDLGHRILAEPGSERGEQLLSSIKTESATSADLVTAKRAFQRAEREMGRRLDTDDIKDLLFRNAENPYWDKVAERCMTCANCTMVCPTCFCSTIEDTTSLDGQTSERWRSQDSCFTADFSYIHGGSVRYSPFARYRQWITHKLASWIDQFGTSGCVGCGRCITWCPVGIDITAEVEAIRANDVGELGQRGWKDLEEF